MRIIKVSATESTNTLARECYQANKNEAPFCVVAELQTMGRGQRGAGWVSNAGENLTMSVVFPQPQVEIQNQFVLSATVGIAVLSALQELKINKLKLKWPNDIMAANFKIGGILIENILSNGSIGASIIGLGININQTEFPLLPKATSLRSLTGKYFNCEAVMEILLHHLEKSLNSLTYSSSQSVFSNYEKVLFRRDMVSTFELRNGDFLCGIIKGITSAGLLKVEVEDQQLKHYDLKELKLLF